MAEWITTKEASEILGVSIRTIQRYIVGGKLKTKVVAGRNSVKKDVVLKFKPTDENSSSPTQSLQERGEEKLSHQPNWQVPEGYLLIDKSTLDSLREQIKKLTDSMGEMQLTQKLLIERGLNLKEDREIEKVLPEPKTEAELAEPAVIDTPIENVAKAHEEFFGKKQRWSYVNLIWLVLAAVAVITVLVVTVNVIASY